MPLSAWKFDNCDEVLAEKEQAKQLAIQQARVRVQQEREALRGEQIKLQTAQLDNQILTGKLNAKRPLLQETSIDLQIANEKLQQKRLKLAETQQKTLQSQDSLSYSQQERSQKLEGYRQKLGSIALDNYALRAANRAKSRNLAIEFTALTTDISSPLSSLGGTL